jgi:hypothetical protein
MTPYVSDQTALISDDEQVPTARAVALGDDLPLTEAYPNRGLSAQWRRLLHRLTHVGPRGNKRPPLGQSCLIMTGPAGQEAGQMGIVTSHTPAMVEVAFLRTKDIKLVTTRKRPSSLVYLETGLVVTQRPDGSVWIEQGAKT